MSTSADQIGEQRSSGLRVRRFLEHLLLSGAVPDSGRLPSSRSIAATLGVARTTVNASLDALVAEGLVTARPRSGYFVNRDLQALRSRPAQADVRQWSERVAITPSAAPTARPDWWKWPYPLVTGQMEAGLLPGAAWVRAVRAAHNSENRPWSYMEHGSDDPLLVEQICSVIAPSRGVEPDPASVIITMGSQHGLWLLSRVLMRPGDLVAIEEPGYPDARAVFASAGATIAPVPVDDEGVQMVKMPTNASIAYVTPSHQHPTNVTLSIARRTQLIQHADRTGLVLVEDDYDSELRYRGPASPSLYSMDRGRNTVYLGTFSKFHSPGLRLGYVVADPAVIEPMRALLQTSVRQVPGLAQRAMALFIRSGDYTRALTSYRRALAARWTAIGDALRHELGLTQDFPPGGSSVWVRAPHGVDWASVVPLAAQRGVLLTEPASHWFNPPPQLDSLRIGFTAAPMDTVLTGVTKLAEAVDEATRS